MGTASGQMDGQQIRLVTPSGWSNPSGTPGTAGYISSSDTGSKLGYPTFVGNTVSYLIVNVGGRATVAENEITITYTDGTAQNSAVAAPETDKTDTRPKFAIQTRVERTDGWTDVKSIPITVTNAANGTGTAVISPAEIGASSVADYTVTYTAAGTLNGGKVSLDIPTGWTTAVGLKDADGIDIANDLINTATVLVSTTGTLNDADEDGDVVEHLVYAGRTVTATLATLSATQTVSFLIKNVQAPTSVSIDIADVTGTTAGRLTADAIDGTSFVVSSSATVAAPTAIRDVDSNAVSPSVIVRTAAAGTGTAALTTAVTILQGGGDPGTITIRFTPAADMLPGSTVAVTVPTGWTAPVAADADNNPAGELLFATTVGTDGRAAAVANQVTNVTTAISANTVTATLGEDDVIDENSRFDFSFLATTAPTTPGVYPFVVSSGGVAVGDPINISVSKSGPGSGALTTTVSPDPVRANASDQTVTFTYTAAETMTSGAVRVTLPTGWTAPKEDADVDIDNLAVDLSGDYDSVTLSTEGQTIVVSSIALTRGQTTKFKWTGAIQNTAGIVSLVSQSKLTSTGSLGDLSKKKKK